MSTEYSCRLMAVVMFLTLLTVPVIAQRGSPDYPQALVKKDVNYTGYIAEETPRVDMQIVGAEEESIHKWFSPGAIVYIDKGREGGVLPGAVYQIIRPMGPFKHPFTQKKMGFFVRELGFLRVIDVQDKISVAQITEANDTITYGDLLRPYKEYVAPQPRNSQPLARYGVGSGGIKGQIILSRGYFEYLGTNQIVFIDLGEKQGVKPGDYFSIFRQPGKEESMATFNDDDPVVKSNSGYESDKYRGGVYSNDSSRVPQEKVWKNRPAMPRKVVGELMVLRVEKGTAIGVITSNTQEIHVGDHIELL